MFEVYYRVLNAISLMYIIITIINTFIPYQTIASETISY